MSFKQYAGVLAAGAFLALSIGAASAATVVNVDLWDKGADAPMATDLQYTGTSKVDLSKAMIQVALRSLLLSRLVH